MSFFTYVVVTLANMNQWCLVRPQQFNIDKNINLKNATSIIVTIKNRIEKGRIVVGNVL